MAFWHTIAKRVGNAYQALAGRPGPDPRQSTPAQRSFATAHAPGYAISDHLNELQHNTSWTYIAGTACSKQWAQATVNIYDTSAQKRLTRYVRKSVAHGSPDEQREPLPTHPMARLLDRPNPMRSGAEFRFQIDQQQRLTGGYVIWEVRNDLGMPCELWVLPRGWLTWQWPNKQFPMGFWRVFPPRNNWMSGPISTGFYLDVRDTIFGGLPDAYIPGEHTSPLAACSQIIDIMEKTDLATWSFLASAPRPGMVLSINDPAGATVTDEQMAKIEEQIQANKGGAHNAGKTLILQHAELVAGMATPLTEIQSVELREQNKKFAMLVQNTPGVAVGDLDGSTYSGNAAALNGWVELNIQPGLTMFAEKLTHRWRPLFGDDFEVEMSAKRFDDPTLDLQRSDKLLAGVEKGACTINEWRASMDLPPVPDGDELQKPQPAPGDPNAMPGDPSQAGTQPSDDFDLDVDLADDEDTGTPQPDMQAANGNRLKGLLNGFHGNGRAH